MLSTFETHRARVLWCTDEVVLVCVSLCGLLAEKTVTLHFRKLKYYGGLGRGTVLWRFTGFVRSPLSLNCLMSRKVNLSVPANTAAGISVLMLRVSKSALAINRIVSMSNSSAVKSHVLIYLKFLFLFAVI